MGCRPFPGCQVRVTNKKSIRYGRKGGVVRLTEDGDFVVEIDGQESVFEAKEISTDLGPPKKREPEPERPYMLLDHFGQRIMPGDTVVYGKSKCIDVGVVDKLVYFGGKEAVQVTTADGSKAKWSFTPAMMVVRPEFLTSAVRQGLGIEGGQSARENRPMETDLCRSR